jgi:hypothetical protein
MEDLHLHYPNTEILDNQDPVLKAAAVVELDLLVDHLLQTTQEHKQEESAF